MSVQAISWALEQDIPPVQKLVLVVIANCANAEGFNAFPGQDRLADVTKMSVRSVRNHVQWLETRGLLSRERRKRFDGLRSSDGYMLHMGGYRQTLPVSPEGLPASKGRGNRQSVAGISNNDLSVSKNRQNLKEANASFKTRDPKKRTQIPEAYRPSDAVKEKLMGRFTLETIERERKHFIGYHRAKGNVWIDHDRAFQNWMNRVAERKSNGRDDPPVTDIFGNEFEIL